jgi:hypothetical protein
VIGNAELTIFEHSRPGRRAFVAPELDDRQLGVPNHYATASRASLCDLTAA